MRALQGPRSPVRPKVRQNEKTLLLKEFFLFAPKPHEPANQVIKRFYDRVHDIRVAGINIPNDQQMVILLEALSHDPMITERIIQLKEEIERGEGIKTIFVWQAGPHREELSR